MERRNQTKLLSGKRILIVEDEYFLAEGPSRVRNLGAFVIGPAAKVRDALDLIARGDVDAAILDVHLGDELVFAAANELRAQSAA